VPILNLDDDDDDQVPFLLSTLNGNDSTGS
jgi:hypothetical protein